MRAPGEDLAHQGGLAQLHEDLPHQLGRAKHDQEDDRKREIRELA